MSTMDAVDYKTSLAFIELAKEIAKQQNAAELRQNAFLLGWEDRLEELLATQEPLRHVPVPYPPNDTRVVRKCRNCHEWFIDATRECHASEVVLD